MFISYLDLRCIAGDINNTHTLQDCLEDTTPSPECFTNLTCSEPNMVIVAIIVAYMSHLKTGNDASK